MVMALVVLCTPGCASVVHGRTQLIAITSEPSGADVFLDEQQVGVTPLQLDVSRRPPHVLRFEKEGFAAQNIALKRGTSALLIADVAYAANPMAAQGLDDPSQWPGLIVQALAFLIGIDYLTGAAFTLPAAINATLQRKR